MIARIRKNDGKAQYAEKHCKSVAIIAASNAQPAGLCELARLVGILHDMGKFTIAFRNYIESLGTRGSLYHSPTGAIYAYDRWFNPDNTTKTTAQIISMTIRAHHGGLLDCVSPNGDSPYIGSITQDRKPLLYEEAVSNYLSKCCDEEKLQSLFDAACRELSQKLTLLKGEDFKFVEGMITRFVLSCVVDGDRWDAACFATNENPIRPDKRPDWKALINALESHLSKFNRNNKISELRGIISDKCLMAARNPPGIYSLPVLTGGGKTLSSLRFALTHAETHQMIRIFYVIPYNTILEQNAKDIKKALNNYSDILEHYGAFYSDDINTEFESQEKNHLMLTERWDVPIIMTSMVQFLNSAYKGSNSNTRRFCRLAKSVIIFDEIQELPKKSTALFEQLVRFLTSCLGCTVLLCTATQPSLNLKSVPILQDKFIKVLNDELRRVTYIDRISEHYDHGFAATKLSELQKQHGAVLAIVNTKSATREIYRKTAGLVPDGCLKIHLSTNMCPLHRLKNLNNTRDALLQGKPVLCISTMLIEAGVNISFPCVVRSLTRLPSIVQAAGRCNRHMEMGKEAGHIEVWFLEQENLAMLPEISLGQKLTHNVKASDTLCKFDDPLLIQKYFDSEREVLRASGALKYPYKQKTDARRLNLVSMLGRNGQLTRDCFDLKQKPQILDLYQAFASAGKEFEVIDQGTVSVITPYGDGMKIITSLGGSLTLDERIKKMRQAQRYSINVYQSNLPRMNAKGMLYTIGDTGLYALREEYYNEELGLINEPAKMELLDF